MDLIESLEEKDEAQRKLEARLKKSWQNRQTRVVAWRPDSREMTVYQDGAYWFGSFTANDQDATPRYWNPFGRYRENGNLEIAIEINIPTNSDERRVAGFFARNLDSAAIYLMHDGSVGGGRKGIGRSAFLAWSGAQPVRVVNAVGDSRLGIVVASVDSDSTAADIARFVQVVIDFKLAVMTGEAESTSARKEQRTYDDYYREFAGQKRRQRLEETKYMSRHGDIVHTLHGWRKASARPDERLVKNAYIDSAVEANGVLTELYEVKTGDDRQTLYAAIGQLMVHSLADSKDSDASVFSCCRTGP